MDKIELMKKYIAVAEMCKGTALEKTPWKCVKYLDSSTWFQDHPDFCNENNFYNFAISIVEDKPVFVGDILYDKRNPRDGEHTVTGINDNGNLIINWDVYQNIAWIDWKKNATWNKPEERTFSLNGITLPSPLHESTSEFMIRFNYSLFYFKTIDDWQQVVDAFQAILMDAREKP